MLKRRSKTPDTQAAAGAEGLAKLGAELRAARTARGEDLDDIATYLRIRPHYLEALERGDLAALPARPYAIGFLRAYAESLELDAADMVAQLKACTAPLQPPTLVPHEPVPESRRPTASLMAASLLLLGATYVGYRLIGGDGAFEPAPVAELPSPPAVEMAALPPEPLPAPAPVEPVASAAIEATPPVAAVATEPPPAPIPVKATPAPAADVTSAVAAEADVSQPIAILDVDAAPPPAAAEGPADGRVVLIARESSWVQVRSASRDWVRTRTMAPGEQIVLPNRSDLALWTGNAGGVELVVDGQSIGRLGAMGAVLKDLSLEPESLKQRPPVTLP